MNKSVKRFSIALCLLFCGLPGLQAAEGQAWPPEHMKKLPADYLERLNASVSVVGERLDKVNRPGKAGKGGKGGKARKGGKEGNENSRESIGWVRFGFSGLMNGTDVAEINRFFESDDFKVTANPKFGFSLFSISYLRLYGVLNSHSGSIKGRLSPAAEANFEKGFWTVAKANSKLAEAQRGVWDTEGSENHHISSKSADFLVSQYLRRIPAYADQKYDDGSSLDQQYEARRKYWLNWFDARAKRGQFTEAASTSYQGDSIAALFNLRDFAEDPVLQKKADMYLDLTYANIAEETLLNARGGPKSRVKVGHEYDGALVDRSYDVIFNAPGRTFEVRGDTIRGTSDYYPAPAIVSLAKDTTGRGTYAFVKRWPGPVVPESGRGLADVDDEGTLWRTLDPEKSVLRYGFATPGYVMGSAGVDPGWTEDPSSGHRWQGVIFANNVLARIGFEAQSASDAKWHAFNSFFSVQDRNILVTQAWNPVPPNPKSTEPAVLRVYFSPTLDSVQDESGWIFVKSGSSFAAVKPVGDYEWTPAWKHGDTVGKDNKSFITLKSKASPVITIANQASDYNNDFDVFKAGVKAQPIRFGGGVLEFATITFSGTAAPPRISGRPVNLAPARGYDSPFIRSDWNSGLIYIRKGNETEVLDFRDPENPIKTVGAPLTADFPPGVGEVQPIVFARQ